MQGHASLPLGSGSKVICKQNAIIWGLLLLLRLLNTCTSYRQACKSSIEQANCKAESSRMRVSLLEEHGPKFRTKSISQKNVTFKRSESCSSALSQLIALLESQTLYQSHYRDNDTEHCNPCKKPHPDEQKHCTRKLAVLLAL